ncbi:MAG: carboxypeptidase regulatory-like domain-containing protein [Nitrospirae bacterium]|nr:carboxypeptidase regulatory-like domain-containing protein [Nitrospirota bacterium]
MRIVYVLCCALLFISVATGCYAGISGTVVEAETGTPIEGAVVLVEWTMEKGLPGLSHTESYKVVEVVSDKEGKFKVSGVLNPLVDPPHVTVYKKGYVAWNNKFIFPDFRKREDFKWANGISIKMELFDKGKYTYNDHTSFISDAIHSWSVSEKKSLIKKAYEWENEEAFKERREKTKE